MLQIDNFEFYLKRPKFYGLIQCSALATVAQCDRQNIMWQNRDRSIWSTFKLTFILALPMILFYFSEYAQSEDGPLIYHPCKRAQIWRYFTGNFIHDGGLHLGGNLFYHLIYGCLLEPVYGSRRLAIIYFVGTFFSAIVPPIYKPSDMGVGASGAILALQGALIAPIFVQLQFNWIRLILLAFFVQQTFEGQILFLLRQIIILLFEYAKTMTNPASKLKMLELIQYLIDLLGVDSHSHYAGNFAGLFLGFCVLPQNGPIIDKVKMLSTIILVGAALLAIWYHLDNSGNFWTNSCKLYNQSQRNLYF